MELTLFNSLSHKKEVFKPLIDGKASIYCCGPTVYDIPHIGNIRPVIAFDVLRNLLEYLNYDVTFVSNYTDVDDKIIKRAQELHCSEKELTDRIIPLYEQYVSAVGSRLPDIRPRPTECMNEIINYIVELEKKGFAYHVDGDVFFRVRKIDSYGSLSNNTIASLEEGARIDVNSKKEDPLDFALWKNTDDGGIRFMSPWGLGRPGWHSECCVMIDTIFRAQNGLIDIHCGGFDLKFPHHENEIAQSLAHNGNHLANYWLHNGFIDLGDEKMSKSLGNVVRVDEVLDKYGGLAFRLMVLSTHYRSPVSYKDSSMQEAKNKIEQLSSSLKKAAVQLSLAGQEIEKAPLSDEVLSFLLDDLNVPNALSYLYEENKKMNVILRGKTDIKELLKIASSIRSLELLLGFDFSLPHLNDEDKKLYLEYNKAREEKDFAKSDKLRTILMAKGFI